jgi:GAF domain-containing protein
LPEQSYDDLAGIARTICDTPVANVTLVAEDRQWFKSRVGSDATETPIEQSVCAHTIAEQTDLIINDLRDDPRTRTNLLVTRESALRFYAGVPLRLESSFGVGTLCVLDTKPHPAGLSRAQTEALRALGRQVTILLQVRKFLAQHNADDTTTLEETDCLESVSEHLMAAYSSSKQSHDQVLDLLLSATLLHVGRKLSSIRNIQ